MGLTQQDVGDALGIRFQQVQKYESAANRMSAAVLWKLANLLEVDVRYFFDGLPEIGVAHTAGMLIDAPAERPAL